MIRRFWLHLIVKAEIYYKSQENFLGNFSCHFILLREIEDSTIESKMVIWKSIKVSKKIFILHHYYYCIEAKYYENQDFNCILSYYRILNVKKFSIKFHVQLVSYSILTWNVMNANWKLLKFCVQFLLQLVLLFYFTI